MKELNFENFETLKSQKFIELCDKLYNCFVNSKEKYFSQNELDELFELEEIDYKGKYATLYNEERLFERGYNKNIINLLNVFFNLYRKNIQVFVLNGDSLIEILPGKKVKQKRIEKKIMKMKKEKLKDLITREITAPRLQRY